VPACDGRRDGPTNRHTTRRQHIGLPRWHSVTLINQKVSSYETYAFLVFSGPELAFTFATCYRRSVCLSSVVCRSSVCLFVTLVHPTQAVELFGNFFHHTIAQGLYFSGAKNRWWGTPISPKKFRSKWCTLLRRLNFSAIFFTIR